MVLTRIGDAHRKAKRFEASIRIYDRALAIDPSNPYALRGRADGYRGLRDYGKAVESWEAYLRWHPDNPQILARLGNAWKTMGELDMARDAYITATRVDKDYIFGQLGLVDIELLKGRRTEAENLLRQAMKCHPHDPAPICRLADNYRRHGDPDSAEIIYRTAMEWHSDNKYLMTGLAALLLERRDFDRAVSAFNELNDLHPGDEIILTGLGDAYKGRGDVGQAASAWRAALNISPDNRFLLTRCGDACRRLGRPDEAVAYYAKALAADSHDFHVLQGLSMVLREYPNVAVDDRLRQAAVQHGLHQAEE
jgi:tetratricopeptide (TPR) repeat protein